MNADFRNIKYLHCFSALRSFDALLPFYVLYTQQCGLTYFDIFITQIVFSIALLLLDIPLGIYSDLYGRKKSLLLGGIASCVGLGLFVLWPVFWGFIWGEIALALSFAAFSGSDTALLFETTKQLKQEESYCEQEGKYQSYARYSEGLSSILGGVLASFSLALPALITWLLSFPRLGLTLFLHETQTNIKSDFSTLLSIRVREKLKTIRLYFIKDKGHSPKNSIILWILLYSGLISAVIINTFWLLQVFLKTYHVNFLFIGLLILIYHSTTGFVASRAFKIISHPVKIAWILPLLLQCMVIVLGVTHSAWWFPAFLIASLVFGIKMPFIYNSLHLLVEDKVRASILSFDSFCTRLLFCIIALPIGWILDNGSINLAFLFLTIPNLLIFWIVLKKKLSVQ